MKTLGLSSNLAMAVLIWLAIALPEVASADNVCPDGFDCVGPEVGRFYYQVADGYIGLAQGTDEASTIAAYKEQVQTNYNTCTFDLTDNLPAWQPAQIGHGGAQQGDYNAALFDGVGQYWVVAWTLSTETSATSIPLVLTGTYPNSGSPPCSRSFGQRGVYVQRARAVYCPTFYGPNVNTPNAPNNSFCYRQATARRPAKNLGRPCPACGNPINPSSGNKFQEETDYIGSGPMPLRFVRYYNSHRWTGIYLPSTAGAFNLYSNVGANWTTSYDRVIRFSDGALYPTVYAYRPDSRTLLFKLANGQFVADPDTADRVVRLTDGSGNPVGWQYTVASTEEVETYDNSGKLLSIASRAGALQTLAYDSAGRLATVSDSFGRMLTLAYDANGRLGSLTDPDGKVYSYQYNSATNMSSVTYPDGTLRSYVYNEAANTSGGVFPFAMTGILDEAGVRFATFKYNSSEYAISTEHAGGVDRYTITYPGTTFPQQATITDPLGHQQFYTFSTLHGVAKTATLADLCTGCATITNSYDANGNIASRNDKNGNITNYIYDLTRNLETSRTEAYGTARARTITTQWHATFRLPTQIDEPGKRTTFTHDANGNVLTKTALDTALSESRTWTYTYNSSGQVLTANGPRTDVSDVTTYTYYSCTTGSQCGQVHTITNALGHVTTYNSYNAHGQPLTITDPNGVVTTLTYDFRQRLTSRTVGSEQTSFDYWPTGLLKKATLPDGNFLEYTYDGAHRLTGIENSEGNRIVYTVDAMGNRTAEQLYDPSNALAQSRTRVFNTLNRLSKEIGAAGTSVVTTNFSYDNNGNQTGIDAPLSRDTAEGYDELNRLNQVTDPLSGITQYDYNALDQLISVTDPRSKVTSYTYNALGDLTQQVSPDTGTTTNTYDSGGNLLTSTDARSKSGSYAYDALNRVTSVTYPDQTISYTYDSGTNQKGRLTQLTDASGSTSWSYDTQGRVLSRQQSMGVSKTLGYAYDSAGRLQTLTLPSGNTITYSYTDGKVTSLMLNGSTTILSNVLYQPFGPTRGWTWGNSTLAIREYDTDGKVTYIDSAGLKSYSYDDAFRITGITDASEPSLSQGFGYDKADRLANVFPQVPAPLTIALSATNAAPGDNVTVTLGGIPAGSGYWLALARSGAPVTTFSKWTQVTPSSGSFVWNVTMPSFADTYEVRLFSDGFNSQLANALITVSAPPPPPQATLAVNAGSVAPGGRVTMRLTNGPGGSYDWLTFVPVGAPIGTYMQWTYVGSGVTNRDWTVTMPNTEDDYEFRLFLNNGWTLGAASGPVWVNDEAPVSGGGVQPITADYTYDANGNRLTGEGSSYTISSTGNRLMSVSGALTRSYSYDNSGNTTGDGTATFTYNDAGRMTGVTKASVTTTYALNALGQRVKKTTSGASRYFVYDESGHLVGEYDNSGNLIQETVWFGDIPVATLRPSSGGVGLFYIHSDHLNTPRRISRPADNAIVWRWDSDPFGTTAANEDPDGDSIPFRSDLRFPGQYFDAETGLHYNYRRDLDPQIGRYAESDPIGLRGGLNTYAYALSNPIRYIDANGLESYAGDNFAGTNWPAFPKKPADPSQCGCSWRWPDFVTAQLDFYVGSTSLTFTRAGDVFWGKGFGRQYVNPYAIGVSLSDGWLLKCNPTTQDVNDFLTDWAASLGGYRVFGGSFSFNSSGAAMNLGVGYGQANFSASPGVMNSHVGNIFDE